MESCAEESAPSAPENVSENGGALAPGEQPAHDDGELFEDVSPELDALLSRAEADFEARRASQAAASAAAAASSQLETPWFYASELGALMGCGWIDADEALLSVCQRHPVTSSWVRQAKLELQMGDADDLRAAAARAHPEQLQAAAVARAAAATAAATSVEAAAAALATAMSEAAPAIAAFAQGDKRVAAELRAAHAGAIHKARGVLHEPGSLDAVAKETAAPVTERNADTATAACRGFNLCGKIDGLATASNTLIESKSRRCPLSRAGEPRTAHLIQVRAYLRLLSPRVQRGVLREHFGCGGVRETQLEHDEGIWRMIEDSLSAVAADFAALTREDVRSLVEAKCISMRPVKPGEPHPHPLLLTTHRRRAVCDLCDTRPDEPRFFTCARCDYDECEACHAAREAPRQEDRMMESQPPEEAVPAAAAAAAAAAADFMLESQPPEAAIAADCMEESQPRGAAEEAVPAELC